MNAEDIKQFFGILGSTTRNAIFLRNDPNMIKLEKGHNPKMWFKVPGTSGFLTIVHVDRLGGIPMRLIVRMQSEWCFDKSAILTYIIKFTMQKCVTLYFGKGFSHKEEYNSNGITDFERKPLRYAFECIAETDLEEFPLTGAMEEKIFAPFFKDILPVFCEHVEWVIDMR